MIREEQMNRLMRDLLIEHIDLKPIPVLDCMKAPTERRDAIAGRHHTLIAAWRRGFIEFDRHPAPQTSIITQTGRHALALALSDWADALSRSHYGLDRLLPDAPGSRGTFPPVDL